MPKRRAKKTGKIPAPSSLNNTGGDDGNDLRSGKNELREEVSRRSAAIRAIRDMEVEGLLTQLRLLRSYFNKEQLETPLLQFFKDYLPNLEIVGNGKNGECVVQWRDKQDMSINLADENIHTSLLQHIVEAYPDCSVLMSSLHGLEFSRKTSLLAADNLQIRDFDREELSETQTVGLQGLQTPGVTSQRLSVGMTPKTLRVPKPGEMLLSVRGSPLGLYKEDNMEAINESEEA